MVKHSFPENETDCQSHSPLKITKSTFDLLRCCSVESSCSSLTLSRGIIHELSKVYQWALLNLPSALTSPFFQLTSIYLLVPRRVLSPSIGRGWGIKMFSINNGYHIRVKMARFSTLIHTYVNSYGMAFSG